MTRTLRTLGVAVLALIVVGGGAFAFITTGQTASQSEQTQSATSIQLSDQTSDERTVIVDSVTLSEGGYVVIHDAGELEAGLVQDSVIGVSTYLEAGTHEDVPVTLAEPIDDDSADVTAMAHQDTNGNEAFDFLESDGEEDGPYTTEDQTTPTPDGVTETPEVGTDTPAETETVTPDETETVTETETTVEGQTTEEQTTGTPEANETETPMETDTPAEDDTTMTPVTDTATIDVDSDEGPNTNMTFEDQSSDGTTVTVDRVTLYRGGYIAIHENSLGDDGDPGTVIGSTGYMEPGTYEDVEITLATEIDDSMMVQDGEVELNATAYHDENGNQAFDYVISDGEIDVAYNSTNSSATADVTLEDGGSETATPTEEMTDTPTEEMTDTPAVGEDDDTPTAEAGETTTDVAG